MQALEQIAALIGERGAKLDSNDLQEINLLSVDVPLEDSDALAMTMGAVALIVNDPLYEGDIPPMD